MSSNNPAHIIRFGMIKCEILLRHTRSGDRFVVTATRLFRNGEQWQESKQFYREDLLLLAKALDLCHTWIYAHGDSLIASRQPAAKPTGKTR
jgi:hypothetical protein